MKERLFTFACAVGALLLFAGMFLRREGGLNPRDDIPRPTTAERRGNGYNAAMAWLEAEKIRVVSMRDRLDKIVSVQGLAPAGNLLIITLPAVASFETEEFLPLDRWIRAGNTLLVLAALADTPDWALRSAATAVSDVNLLTGLEFETARMREERLRKRQGAVREALSEEDDESLTSDLRAFAESHRSALIPNRPHAYFNGVDQVVALSDYATQPWSVKVPYQGFVLALAKDRDSGEGVLWTRPLGAGRIVVSGFGSILTNRALGLQDNGQFLANLIAANVAERGAVLFDDAHQGLGATYDPQKFYRDGRLYATIGILLALWLIWVLGSTRLRAVAQRAPIPREPELVRTAGGFFARILPPHAAARTLLDHFFRRVNERAQRQGTRPPWESLERHPRVSAADLEQLRNWYAQAFAGQRVPLGRLYNLILRIEESIA